MNQSKVICRLESETRKPNDTLIYPPSCFLSNDNKTLGLTQGDWGQERTELFSIPSGKRLPFSIAGRHFGHAFSADNRWLAWADKVGMISLIDLETRRIARKVGVPLSKNPEKEAFNPTGFLAFSPDGAYLASAPAPTYTLVSKRFDNHLRLWDVRTGKQVDAIEIPGFDGTKVTIACLVVAADNRTVVLGFVGKSSFLVYDVVTGMFKEISGHEGPVVSLAFHPNGKTLVSGSADTTALVWDSGAVVAGSSQGPMRNLDPCSPGVPCRRLTRTRRQLSIVRRNHRHSLPSGCIRCHSLAVSCHGGVRGG